MPNTLQEFLATATQKAADDLTEALLRIPEDKRAWRPEDKGRSALDQVAECALLCGYTSELLQSRVWTMDDFSIYTQEKDEAVKDWDKLSALLQENAKRVIGAIRAVPDADLADEIQMPWSKQTVAEIVSYSYWNMAYHQGQINYIASLLGCLN
jgi:uncharacterized damage-inducible protein DinB